MERVVVDSSIDFDKEGASKILEDLKKRADNIKTTFDDTMYVMDVINGDFSVWKGISQESFYDSFKSIADNFPLIVDTLDSKNDFLRTTIENYERGENKINSNIEEKSEELDIN